jgi:hypothetical protein
MDVVLLALGGILALVGWVWILISAFAESILWGVGVFLLSPLALVFGILHWEDLKVPTIMYAVGLPLYILGRVLSS